MEPGFSLPHSQMPNTCPYPEPARSSPYPSHPTSWGSILVLPSHLHLGLPSGLFPSGFPTETLYTPVLHTYYMPRPSHSRFGHPNNTVWGTQIMKLHSPVTSSLLDPNVLLSTLFSNTLSLRSSLNVSHQVSHPYKTTGGIVVLYSLFKMFIDMQTHLSPVIVSRWSFAALTNTNPHYTCI